MNRYLKYAKMKAKDGTTVKFPSCCISCPKKKCPFDCIECNDAIKECSQGEVEFEFVDDWWDVFCKTLIRISLIALAGWVLFLFSENVRQKSEVSVERYFIDTAYGSELKISYSGHRIDTNAVLMVVDKAAHAMAKPTGGKHD